MTIKKPYLVQRATIARPIRRQTRLGVSLDLDYMGSSEFEFGATFRSLKALQNTADTIKVTTDSRVLQGSRSLRVLHAFTEDLYQQYFLFLKDMRAGKMSLKENPRFAEDYQQSTINPIDFWWDIENHVMWSFDKVFMNCLRGNLEDSWKYMNSTD